MFYLPLTLTRLTSDSNSGSGGKDTPDKQGILPVFCTSIELISAVRCYELVLDVRWRRFTPLTPELILFTVISAPAQAHRQD